MRRLMISCELSLVGLRRFRRTELARKLDLGGRSLEVGWDGALGLVIAPFSQSGFGCEKFLLRPVDQVQRVTQDRAVRVRVLG